ncbi:MAG: hypothetical protein KF809_14200 [Chloroflexi bacterium]|nr:hypothetical protein [Chloroflexota bacterium]
MTGLRIVDVTELPAFQRVPPCLDTRFDHRTCDYWEDADRGSNHHRAGWLDTAPRGTRPTSDRAAPLTSNPFAPPARGSDQARDALAAALFGDTPDDPMADAPALGSLTDPLDDDPFGASDWNPFAPTPARPAGPGVDAPRKLRLLTRGLGVFGSYARVAIDDEMSVAYAQFGPLSAYPRAQRLRELYPALPAAPLPAVITCIAATPEGHARGHARDLVADVCHELGRRGFAAVEAYPDLTRPVTETSAGTPAFWQACGFVLAVEDERYPVVRLEL